MARKRPTESSDSGSGASDSTESAELGGKAKARASKKAAPKPKGEAVAGGKAAKPEVKKEKDKPLKKRRNLVACVEPSPRPMRATGTRRGWTTTGSLSSWALYARHAVTSWRFLGWLWTTR